MYFIIFSPQPDKPVTKRKNADKEQDHGGSAKHRRRWDRQEEPVIELTPEDKEKILQMVEEEPEVESKHSVLGC